MGSCVSVHKDPESAMKFRMSFGSRNEKLIIPSPLKEKTEMVNGVGRTVAEVAFKSQWSPARPQPVNKVRDYDGSKDAIFFDSQPWLDSDCEDDFLSVNGDFTPSRGNTPVHHSFSLGNSLVNKASVVEENTIFSKSEPEPGPGTEPEAEPEPGLEPEAEPGPGPEPEDKRKRLSELFKESLRVEEHYPDEESAAGDDPAKVGAEANSHVPQVKSTAGNPSPTLTPYLSGANSVCNSEGMSNGAGVKSAKLAQCCLPRLLSSHSFIERKKKTSPSLSTALAKFWYKICSWRNQNTKF